LFAKTSYVRFVPGGDHLGIACIFHKRGVTKKSRIYFSPFYFYRQFLSILPKKQLLGAYSSTPFLLFLVTPLSTY